MASKKPSFAEFLRLQEQALQQRLDFAQAAATHAGEKGRNLEHHAMTFLRSILPNEYGLGTGFVAHVHNDSGKGPFRPELSTQIDIVIYDNVRGGPIMDMDTFHVYPLEHVLGVVEVKASLNDELPELMKQSEGLRKMISRHYTHFVAMPCEAEMTPEQREQSDVMAAIEGKLPPWYRELWKRSELQAIPVASTPVVSSWLPIRYFCIAFELGRKLNVDDIKARIRGLYRRPAHFHAVLVPNACALGHVNAMAFPEREGEVWIDEAAPIAAFRRHLLEQLATFPKAPPDAVVSLHQYFRAE